MKYIEATYYYMYHYAIIVSLILCIYSDMVSDKF